VGYVASNVWLIHEWRLEKVYKAVAVANFKLLSQTLSGGAKENQEKSQSR